MFESSRRWWQATEASRQRCRLSNLSRLVDLHILSWFGQTLVDLDLPPSLTQLNFQAPYPGSGATFDIFGALLEAVKCIKREAQLHKLICERAVASLQPAQWGASLDEQHRRLGGQLCGLRELEVWGGQEQVFSALGAVASAAPSLVRLEIVITDWQPRLDVSPICSASLESIRVTCEADACLRPGRPPWVLLTLLPGCTWLQEVVVQFTGRHIEGATVNTRCHCCGIQAVDGYGTKYRTLEAEADGGHNDVVVRFPHMPPPSEQGVRECTVLFDCHAAGPDEAPDWGHAVLPFIS